MISPLDGFSDQEVLAKVIWGEARSLGADGMADIAAVVLNRIDSGVTWWGNDIRSVCTKPWQFSCLNKGDPNLPKLIAVDTTNAAYCAALSIAALAVNNKLPDSVSFADSYFSSTLPYIPRWAQDLTPVHSCGNIRFYRTVYWKSPLVNANQS